MKKRIVIAFLLVSTVSVAQDSSYEQAYKTLTEMLKDSTKYNFKKAVFTVENAYLDGALDTSYYSSAVSHLALLSKAVMKSNELNEYNHSDKDKVKQYASIYRVMKDSIEVIVKGKKWRWTPFSYDFNDIWGDKDWSNTFISKLIDTNSGNCHSLPYLYKILAEEIGVEAHLALAPNHVYIKQQNLKDGWYNTELTSGYFPNDGWIMASGYVHLDGVRNGMYMKALSDKESISLLLIDLAQGYQKKFPYNDISFILKCCETALKYYPTLANALLLKLETTKKELEQIAEEKNKKINEILEIPKAKVIWENLNKQVKYIHELGYRQMPKEMYLDWLVSLKKEKEKYVNKKISTFNKQK